MKLDALEQAILEKLTADPRMTNKELADKLDSAEATIASRIRDLEARNVLRIIMQSDLRLLNFDLFVLVDIYVEGRTPEEVAADLVDIEEVASVSVLLSKPDILLQINARDRKHLLEIIETKIAKVSGISHWNSDIALEIVKLNHRYGDIEASL